MSDLDYKPNSNRYKKEQSNALAERKKIEKVVTEKELQKFKLKVG